MRAILTLQVPDFDRKRPFIVAASTNRDLLQHFRRVALFEARERAKEYEKEGMLGSVCRLEADRLERVLDLLIPERQSQERPKMDIKLAPSSPSLNPAADQHHAQTRAKGQDEVG